MRIGIDARESGTSTGRYVDELVRHLSKLRPEHEFVILTKASRVEFMQQIAPNFEVVKCDYKEFSFGEQYGFVWQLYGLRLDLVHFPAAQQPALYFGKTVTTIQDLTTARFNNPSKNWLVFKFKQLVYRGLIKWVGRKSEHLIAISDWVKYDLMHFARLPAHKVSTVLESYGVIESPSKPYERLKGKRFIMYLGRPMPHKNLNRLAESFGGLQSKYPDLHLVLVGKMDANYRSLQGFVDRKGYKNVHFTDWLEDSQAKWLYEHTLAYVVPSLSEGFGMPGLEAMDYGAPVASSYATCSPEIYRDAALYFDPYDTEDMAAKIEQLINNKALAKALMAKGEKVIKRYSWKRTAKETLDIYNSILKPPTEKLD